MDKRPGTINMLELYIPNAGAISSRKRIPLYITRDNSKHKLLISPLNNIQAIGEIHVCGGYHEYLGLRGNILNYNLKFCRVSGGFNIGCDGKVVEISTVGHSLKNSILSVDEFINDDDSVLEALFEVVLFTGEDIENFFSVYIKNSFEKDIKYVRGVINDNFRKN